MKKDENRCSICGGDHPAWKCNFVHYGIGRTEETKWEAERRTGMDKIPKLKCFCGWRLVLWGKPGTIIVDNEEALGEKGG